MLHRLCFVFFCFLVSMACRAAESEASPLSFRSLPILNGLSNKDIQSIYQDRDGYLWISTRNGLFQYDGYSIVTYKSNLTHPDLLTNNNILCVAEDNKHNLWIGTYSGLNVLDKRTGRVRKIDSPEMNGNSIPCILVTKQGRVLLATDWGLYEYMEETDRFQAFGYETTGNVMPQTAVKSLFEDDRGDIWIGTWNRGLYRYESSTGKYYGYPRLNAQNSAHVVFQDSRKNIWVGTWRGGLMLLKDAYEPARTTWIDYRNHPDNPAAISDDIIYSIAEDINTGALWVGTRRGLSVLRPRGGDYTGSEAFSNYYPDDSERSIASDEVTSVLCDRQGLMWLGMIGGGIVQANTRKPDFAWDSLQNLKRELKTTSVRSMLIDRDNCLWLGMGSYGLAVKDRRTGKTVCYTQLSDGRSLRDINTVMSIVQSSSDGHIWLAAYDDGVYEIEKYALEHWNVKHYMPQDAPWLAGHCVYQVYEDSRHDLWFSTRNGLSMRRADGRAVRLDSLAVDDAIMHNVVTMGVVEGHDGDIWAASGTHGVIRLRHDKQSDTYTLKTYSTRNHRLNSDYVDCLHCDAQGRIWAGTGNSGLNCYDKASDSFLPVHASWNLPGDAVMSIRSDRQDNLWLGTNAGLIRLKASDDLTEATFRLYTTVDGLQDNIFLRGAVTMAPDGEMFFGGHRGYNSFYPDSLDVQQTSPVAVITDIKVYNQSWSSLPEAERLAISALSPGFADAIRLDYRHNNFNIEFSALDYASPERNSYAYRLEGFDDDWQYTDASKRFAYYNNLEPGTYTFYLKASNSNGVWNDEPCRMKVVILPPPWKTWWAYALYVLLVAGTAYGIYRQVRNRIRLRNALQLHEMEKAKAEEVNHAKLQFFTNITHELLTPLTILSASVDELRHVAPEYKEQYRVMNNNINRLIRLLQQILEFRKAESGNLKLKVSRADLALFVRRSLDSFRPLMQRKDMHFSLTCLPERMPVYFDPDKLDKILYNLFSNASKYNRPGGTVSVTLEEKIADGMVCLTVKDDGPGISEEAQKGLFKRFYEGDYRRFKTIGTGIGLSLVRDLVVLHHGTIGVESEEGKGTAFIVTFPAQRSAYAEEEIDDSLSEGMEEQTLQAADSPTDVAEDESAGGEEAEPAHPAVRRTLLIVEDNQDLLQLMTKLLGTDYKVCTATNGKEAIEVVENKEIELIVSDVMMPEMDGIELCRYIKGHFETSHIPIILLTAKYKEEDRVEAYESGADAFISKPFSLSVLHARISNLLRARERRNMDFKKQLVFEVKDLDYTSIDEDFLQRAIDCVNRHLADADFDQSDFLEEMHTSKSTCFRKLKSLTGQTYVSFVRNIRMKAACRIMEEKKNIRISDLAYAVGYNDPRYFSSSFKKEIGMQPTEYMERFTQGGEVIEE